jgi:hypothetical protein
MRRLYGLFMILAVSGGIYGQAQLAKTIDLGTWTGAPVTIVQPPPPDSRSPAWR